MKRTTYKDYPPNWKTEIVPAIQQRAQFACEHCQRKNGQFVWLYRKGKVKHWADSFENAKALGNALPERKIKIVCAVAHLDHDESNMNISLDRLAYLCQKCHLKHDYQNNLDRLKAIRLSINKSNKLKKLVNRVKTCS